MACGYVRVTVGWDEVEPDGSECHDCGDACYLSMVQAYYQIEGEEKQYVKAVLCGGCDEMRHEPENAGEEWKGLNQGGIISFTEWRDLDG